MKIFPVETGSFKLDGGAMFGVVPKILWSKVYPSDEDNLITLSMRSLLIVDGNRRILVNNGMGEKNRERHQTLFRLDDQENNLQKSLHRLGYHKDDITDVFLSHLHFDHCGGGVMIDSAQGLVPAFKNATYHVSRQQWEWAIHPNKREKPSYLPENLLPLAEHGVLRLFNCDGELFPGFDVRLCHGHTQGQAIPFIRYNTTTLVYTSDLLPTTAHLPLPYIMSYDILPLVSLDEKEALLNEAAERQYILFFEHDHYTLACTIERGAKGFKVKDTVTL